MIFVTVGTHEQPFDRLVKAIDDLKADGTLTEEVIIQTGFSTYIPQHCKWKKMYPFSRMQELVRDARIVITHGGPSSFLLAIRNNKVPVVVPRMRHFGEHINDHQVVFCREVMIRNQNILLVEDIERLRDVLISYDTRIATLCAKTVSNNASFNEGVQKIVDELFGKVHS